MEQQIVVSFCYSATLFPSTSTNSTGSLTNVTDRIRKLCIDTAKSHKCSISFANNESNVLNQSDGRTLVELGVTLSGSVPAVIAARGTLMRNNPTDVSE